MRLPMYVLNQRELHLVGRVLDTFVAAQLRPELAASERQPRMFQIHDKGGRDEVDLVVELGGGTVIGVDVKATAAPRCGDGTHLEWMRDQLGDRFPAGVVLHTDPSTFDLADRITALPIAALWSTNGVM